VSELVLRIVNPPTLTPSTLSGFTQTPNRSVLSILSRYTDNITLQPQISMKALVFKGHSQTAIEERPKPEIQLPTDVVVKVLKTTICGEFLNTLVGSSLTAPIEGTDLHILRGDVPTCPSGRILGHEAIGVIDSVGASIKKFKLGDRVIVFPITTCAACDFCRRGLPAHCNEGGWQLGHHVDGTQAEFVRVLHADGSLQHMVEGASDDAQVILSDVLTTGYELGAVVRHDHIVRAKTPFENVTFGVQNGRVKPGCTVAIIGAGPVGLGALISVLLYSPASIIMIDLDTNRLEMARAMGATHTLVSDTDVAKNVMALTGGRGVDTVIEAVGVPSTFALCQDLVSSAFIRQT
jgi:alcohol dehydrogenase